MADRFSYSCTRDHSSFSSTLLDEICRSIDRGGGDMRKKRDGVTARFLFDTQEQVANYQRACMIEKWMEKKLVARHQMQEKISGKDRQNSSSSSSDSSSGGGAGGFFTSSEAESYPIRHPKPVRTGKLGFEKETAKSIDDSGVNLRNPRFFTDGSEQKPATETKSVKTKAKALKIYGDLKKVKQPISPGGKVAAFLNSLFTAGNFKKPKSAAACGDDSPSLKSTTTTTCSSASSFSRSCLSKATTPSSAKSAGNSKRSVRFYPVSVIVDEDCQPCGHKSLNQKISNDVFDLIETGIDEHLLMHVMEKNRRVEEAAGDFAMQRRKKDEFELSFDIFSKIRDQNRGLDREFDDEDEEFDGASCASSDLFELENLSAIGMEELPVYETTHLDKIHGVVNGLIL